MQGPGRAGTVGARPGDGGHCGSVARGRRALWERSPGTVGTVGARPGDGGQFGPAAWSTGGASLEGSSM